MKGLFVICLTNDAVNEVKRLQKNIPGDLRIYILGAGCHGLQFKLVLDEEITANDLVFEQDGIKIVCDNRSILYVDGAAIDYDSEKRGFVVENNIVKSCNCGSKLI